MPESKLTTCPLCGNRFDREAEHCHVSCPMADGCRIICCPNCGYQMVDEARSTTLAVLRGLWRRWQGSVEEDGA